MSKDVIFVGT